MWASMKVTCQLAACGALTLPICVPAMALGLGGMEGRGWPKCERETLPELLFTPISSPYLHPLSGKPWGVFGYLGGDERQGTS